MIAIGKRVETPLGGGVIVGEESFYGGSTWRAVVRLDDQDRWFGGNGGDPLFFEREISVVDDRLRDATKMVAREQAELF